MAWRMHSAVGQDACATKHAVHIRGYLLELWAITRMGHFRERRK